MKNSFINLFTFLCLAAAAYTECYGGLTHDPLWRLLKTKESRKQDNNLLTENLVSKEDLPVVGSQNGWGQNNDKIVKLPGQPFVKFNQYSGYVTVDPHAGRALFYYFAEAENSTDKPLVLWLNGGPGCSSMGFGAMTELGPFRVNPDGKTLWYNEYAWNNVSNVLFLESPAGVGFSYSKRSSDYVTGDKQTAADSYAFLVNWFDRFPEYKTRDFYIAGEGYAGHYIPQLAELILSYNRNTKSTVIRLKGIIIGNAWIDDKDLWAGMFDHWWTHAIISDETHEGIITSCNFSPGASISRQCINYTHTAITEIGNINLFDIYAPLCLKRSSTDALSTGMSSFDPCSLNYVHAYLNTNEVQRALHASVAGITRPWELCNFPIKGKWTDRPTTIIPVINNIKNSGIRVLIYSGDTDAAFPVTATKYSLPKFGANETNPWFPWYNKEQVGGFAVGYDGNLTFATVKGAGHMVPSYRPDQALTLFTSFLQDKLAPEPDE